MGWQEQLRAKQAETERWMRQREADLRRAAAGAEARGRQVYADAIKTGQKVLARTPAELRALGVAAAQGRLPQVVGERIVKEVVRHAPSRTPQAPAPSKPPTAARTSSAQPKAKPIEEHLRAGVSGAVDELSFGLADRGLAAAEALMAGGVQDFGRNYDANMAIKRSEDARDEREFAAARNTGRFVGLVTGLAATGPAGAAVKAGLRGAPRLAKVMTQAARKPQKLKVGVDPRGLTTAAVGGGALVGVGGQGANDLISGKASSAQDYMGAALGGGLGGAAALRRAPLMTKAVLAGAVGGGATELAQDALDGRAISIGDAIGAAHVGGVTAGLLDGVATHALAAAPSRVKGVVGEGLSAFKTLSRSRVPGRQRPVPVGRYRPVPDQRMERGFLGLRQLDGEEYLEAKMGPYANLSRAQRALRNLDPARFAIDAWQFRHAGRAASLLGGPAGAQVVGEDRRRGP